uniref:ATP synthase F0 subunit b n=1 Tax=Ophirina amphinema TaxID=2108040 RepID=A0A348AYU8_9EUKA|nr:ATP synthase F0 subunit b [Ophirina amphinema]
MYLGTIILLALSSQYFIILDEEFLVFLCFLGVLSLLIKKVGPLVSNGFDSKSGAIKNEFERLSYAQSGLVLSMWYQQRVLQDSLQDLEQLHGYCLFVAEKVTSRKVLAYRGFLCQEIISRLDTLRSTEARAIASVQDDVVSWVCKI